MTHKVARGDLNLGVLIFRQARLQATLQRLEAGHDGFAALGNDLEVAVIDLYRAHVYLALNLIPEALALAEQCQPLFESREMQRQVGIATVVQGVSRYRAGDYENGLKQFDRARRLFRPISTPTPIWSTRGASCAAWG